MKEEIRINTYAPVLIPTLNRYEHFRRCVESLARCTHAEKTELIIGVDYPPSDKYVEGWKRICEYVQTITGFRKVTIVKRLTNYGALKNWEELREYAFKHYDAVIFTEDDNVFSPCFIDYMNKALSYYWGNNQVMSISGYLAPNYYGKVSQPLLFNYDNNAWGLGIWKHKNCPIVFEDYVGVIKSTPNSWKVFRSSPAIMGMLVSMVREKLIWGDVARSVSNILNNTFQLRPSFSLVRNTGMDGSGLHSGIVNVEDLVHQEISKDLTFDYDMSDVAHVDNSAIRKQLWLHRIAYKSFYRRIAFFAALTIRYFRLRLSLWICK